MSFCSKCGQQNSATTKFCIQCGNSLVNKPTGPTPPPIRGVQQVPVSPQTPPCVSSTAPGVMPSTAYVANSSGSAAGNKPKTILLLLLPILCILGAGVWYFGFSKSTSSKVEAETVNTATETNNLVREESLPKNEIAETQVIENVATEAGNQAGFYSEPDNLRRAILMQASITGTYSVTADKSYFFNEPDFQTQRNGYMVQGNRFEIEKVQDEFAYGTYVSPSEKETKGWVLLQDLAGNAWEGEDDDAQFPGGSEAFKKYVEANLKNDVVYNAKSMPGYYTVMVGFVVDTDGSPIEVTALNEDENALASEAVRVIEKGLKWKPAREQGVATPVYMKVPVRFFYSAE